MLKNLLTQNFNFIPCFLELLYQEYRGKQVKMKPIVFESVRRPSTYTGTSLLGKSKYFDMEQLLVLERCWANRSLFVVQLCELL